MDAADPRLGTKVGGRYRLDERLAAGGMGVVYKGRDLDENRPVAIKFLHDALAGVPDLVKRFEREVAAMRRLAHPNLIGVHDTGVVAGVPWLVMDYSDGTPLGDVLDHGALSPPRAVAITRQVLAGVAHAHGSGVVHRDLKPDNLLLVNEDGGERVKILDFGLAKLLTEATGATQLTNTGFALGTPGYMSPEQARGDATDERTDIYAVGVILYHMVTGKKPFVGDSPMAVLRMHMELAPRPPRKAAPAQDLSKALDAAILRALEKDPKRRWPSAGAFDAALADTAEGHAAPVAPIARRAAPRRGGTSWLAVALVVAGGAGAAVWWRAHQHESRAALRRTIETAKADAVQVTEQAVQVTAQAVQVTAEAMHALANPGPAPTPTPIDDDTNDDDDHAAAPVVTPGAELESQAPARPHAARPARLADATRFLAAGKIDDAIQTLYQLRKRAPRSPDVALWLGHAYFRKVWRSDGLREYDAALQHRAALRRDRLLVRNVVVALDDPTAAAARALIRARLGTAALGELRRAAREAGNPKVQKRAAHLVATLTPAHSARR